MGGPKRNLACRMQAGTPQVVGRLKTLRDAQRAVGLRQLQAFKATSSYRSQRSRGGNGPRQEGSRRANTARQLRANSLILPAPGTLGSVDKSPSGRTARPALEQSEPSLSSPVGLP